MKKVIILVLLLPFLSKAQITNITGTEPRATVSLTAVKAGKWVLMVDSDNKIWKIVPDSIGSSTGGAGANQQLNNLGTTSINAALLAQTGIDIGSTAAPFRNVRFYGSGTFGSHSFTLDGTPSAHRTITFPDASITVARTDAAQTFTGVQTFSSNPTLSGLSSGQIPYAGTAGAISGTNNLFWFIAQNALILNGASNTVATLQVGRSFTGTTPIARFENSTQSNNDGYVQIGDGVSTGFMPRMIYAGDNTFGTTTFHEFRVVDGASTIGAQFNVTNQAGSGALSNASAKLYQWQSNGTAKMTMDVNGSIGINTVSPTAKLHLPAGTATASTAPLKFTSGTNLTTAEAGAMEYDGTNLFFTRSGTTRETFTFNEGTQTLTNKRITKRVGTTASSSSLTIAGDDVDMYTVTALAADITINAPSGTPTQGQTLLIRLKDNGTGRLITWNAIFRAIGVTLPATTTANKTMYVGCIYNTTDSKWDVVSVNEEL